MKGDRVVSNAYTGFFRRLLLLLWKNLLFRRRQYIVTALEIILPTFLAVVLAFLRTAIKDGAIQHIENTTEFLVNAESDMTAHTIIQLSCGDCILAFSPVNKLTRTVMERLQSRLNNSEFELQGFDSEDEIQHYIATSSINETFVIPEIKAAIIFLEGLDDSFIEGDFPNRHIISYKIRIPTYSMNTKEFFASFQFPGPELENTVTYLNTGFSGLQVMMDKTLISLLTKQEPNVEIVTQAFPYPAYTKVSDFTEFYNVIMPQFLILGFIFIVPSITRSVVSEKETGIKELMKLMGLPNWMHWLGWMLNSLLVLSISISIVVLVLFVTFSDLSGPVILQGDWSLWWVVLFLYVMAATSSIFLITAFTDRPTIATIFGIVMWLLSYYAIYKPLEERYRTLTLLQKMASCLAPNMALHWAIKVLCGLEGKGIGSKWKYFFHPNSAGDGFSIAHICFMLALDVVVFMILTTYIENIVPSQYGVRKPWYYIFQWSTWFQGKRRRGLRRMSTSNIPMDRMIRGFESEPSGIVPGVAVENMSKKYGNGKVAVNGISLKMYSGQITALLGHNGAGKTTTMSMLTGLFPPSSGTASVNGYDITTQMNSVRGSLGLCPQHNMLFDKLTVAEHLLFFGRLKGLKTSEARAEMRTLVKKLDLREKKNSMASSLSGGQKRKLSLGIALIGGSKVVMLDEPTSGMDPEARRVIWDLLLEIRAGRTIVLTTHFMEEADILGDRIAIMADGKIQCCGTPLFLKKCYGSGYSLKITTIESSQNPKREILKLVQKHVPSATIRASSAQDQFGTEITMPVNDNGTETSSVFPQLFSELTAEKERIGIRTIGLSPATMDEVFVKIAEMAGRKTDSPVTKPKLEQYLTEQGLQVNVNGNANGEVHNVVVADPEVDPDILARRRRSTGTGAGILKRASFHRKSMQDFRLRGARLLRQQFLGFLFKKMIYSYRNKLLLLFQFVIPPFLLVAAILVSTRSFTPAESSPPLKLKLSDYSNPKIIYSGNGSFADDYKSVVGRSAYEVEGDISDELVRLGLEDLGTYREECILAGSWNLSTLHALFNTIPYHASPLSINFLSNALLQNLSPEKEYRIEVTNHPLEVDVYNVLESAQPNAAFTLLVPIVFGAFVPIGLALFAATFIVFPIEERVCNAKQLQLMTGAHSFLFWISSFLWDFFLMTVALCIMLLCFVVFQSYDAYTANNGLGVILLILLVYGLSAISFSYFVSFFVSTPANGFALVTIIHILTGMIMPLIMFFLDNAEFTAKTIYFRFFFRIFSTFGASLSVMRYASIATKNSRCLILPDSAKELICYTGAAIDHTIQQCCDNCADFENPDGPSCFVPEPFFTWEYELDGAYGKNPVPGIAQEVLYMLVVALIYKLLIFGIESGFFKKICSLEILTPRFLDKVDDDDVQAESERVDALVSEGCTSEDALVVHSIAKSYGSFAAVSNMSFGVHYGECFGLLGVNGAGKTTSFRMLTGDEIFTRGSAHSSLYSIHKNRRKFLSRVGYCPQFDGLVGVLTGREMLEMFCRLRGVPTRFIKQETDKWLNAQGLYESGDVECRNYSGGMKRRLSVAMAMMGDPPVVLLDEPTSGVDPVARRFFWSVIAQVKGTGQCTVLTSHSMEECEALCSRLGIMVNGQLQCLGGVEHLKDKFAKGYSLTLKLNHSASGNSEEVLALKQEISDKFDPCELKDEHQNVLQYQVVDMGVPWDVIFTNMENIKSSYKGIVEDYAVRQTTLEEVFLSFARKQYTSRESKLTRLRRIVTCN